MAKTRKPPVESSDSEMEVDTRSTKRDARGSLKSKLLFCLLILCCCFVIILVSIAVAGFYYYLFKPIRTGTAAVKTPPHKRSKLRAKSLFETKIEVPPVTLLRYKKKLNYTDAARECKSIPGKYSLAFPKNEEDEHRIHRYYHNMLLNDFVAYDDCIDGVFIGLRRQLENDWVSWDGKTNTISPFFTRVFDPLLHPPPYPANCMCSKLDYLQGSAEFIQHSCEEESMDCYLCQKDCVDGLCKFQLGRTSEKMDHVAFRRLCVNEQKGDLATAPSKSVLKNMMAALKDRPSDCTDIAIGNRFGSHFENINEEPMSYKPMLLWMLANESMTWSCVVIFPVGKIQWHVASCEKEHCYLCVRDD